VAAAEACRRLPTRLAKSETKLRAEDEVAEMLIMLEEDGVWHDWEGAVIDRDKVDPRTQMIRFRLRPDGPQ
jgi:hypothetical protein